LKITKRRGVKSPKKPKGFDRGDPKSPREPLAAARDGVEVEIEA
jgi:hypothetical protein